MSEAACPYCSSPSAGVHVMHSGKDCPDWLKKLDKWSTEGMPCDRGLVKDLLWEHRRELIDATKAVVKWHEAKQEANANHGRLARRAMYSNA